MDADDDPADGYCWNDTDFAPDQDQWYCLYLSVDANVGGWDLIMKYKAIADSSNDCAENTTGFTTTGWVGWQGCTPSGNTAFNDLAGLSSNSNYDGRGNFDKFRMRSTE